MLCPTNTLILQVELSCTLANGSDCNEVEIGEDGECIQTVTFRYQVSNTGVVCLTFRRLDGDMTISDALDELCPGESFVASDVKTVEFCELKEEDCFRVLVEADPFVGDPIDGAETCAANAEYCIQPVNLPTPSPVDPTPTPAPAVDLIDPEPSCENEYISLIRCKEREDTCIDCIIDPPGGLDGLDGMFNAPKECDDAFLSWLSEVDSCCDVCQEFLDSFKDCKGCDIRVPDPTPAPIFKIPTNSVDECQIPNVSVDSECCNNAFLRCDDGNICCYSENTDSNICIDTAFVVADDAACELESCTSQEVGQDFLTMDCRNCRDCLLECSACPNIDDCFDEFRNGIVCSECVPPCYKGSAAQAMVLERRAKETRQSRGYTRGSVRRQ